MEQRLKKMMVNLFDISKDEINDNSSIDNVKGWDSLKHLEFMLAIEEEFEIQSLSSDQIVEMRNVATIKKNLASLGV